MKRTTTKFIKLNIWVACVAFFVRVLFAWQTLTAYMDFNEFATLIYTFLGYIGEAILITAIFSWAYIKWFWKYKWLNELMGGIPVLAKEYLGTIVYKQEGMERSIESKLRIKQSFLDITVVLETNESNSNTVFASIQNVNGVDMLIYTYLNTPRGEIQDKSAVHYGTAMLIIDDTMHLTGNYFTGRKTCGHMEFNAVANKKYRISCLDLWGNLSQIEISFCKSVEN